MATHSSILAWRIPWTEEPGGLQSIGLHRVYMCMKVLVAQFSLVAQLCPTRCDSMDYNPPGSSVHGILQARILEWVAILFSRGSSLSRD